MERERRREGLRTVSGRKDGKRWERGRKEGNESVATSSSPTFATENKVGVKEGTVEGFPGSSFSFPSFLKGRSGEEIGKKCSTPSSCAASFPLQHNFPFSLSSPSLSLLISFLSSHPCLYQREMEREREGRRTC